MAGPFEALTIKDVESILTRELRPGRGLIDVLRTAVAEHVAAAGGLSVADDEIEDYVIEERAQDWVQDTGHEAFKEEFIKGKLIRCGNPSGLYELWGLEKAVLRSKGLIIDWGEYDAAGDLFVRAEWSPPDDHDAYERAAIEAYAASWEDIGLPPLLGECIDGDLLLVKRCMTALLAESKSARGSFAEAFPSAVGEGQRRPASEFGISDSDVAWAVDLSTEEIETALNDDERRPVLVGAFLAHLGSCP